MRTAWVLNLAFAMLLGVPYAFAVDGTFRGKVIDPPANQAAVPGWIFVQGKNHMLRRVEVAHAEIVFGEEVPASQQRKCNSECLSPGQEVRITAHQDTTGEWRAKQVEILKITTRMAETPLKTAALLNFTHFVLSAR
ncbi:MAG: hypothetical protein LAO78_22260 [Acidobacteriia bacterium]|nr:hypothetical protein [Terriglobia bacterium]